MNSEAARVAPGALLVLAACSGGSNVPPSQATAPPPIVRAYTFPAGDATTAPGAVAWDITGVTTTLSGDSGNAGGNAYDKLSVAIAFTQSIETALPAPGSPLSNGAQLGVHVALDVDANPATGSFSACGAPPNTDSFEYATDQGNDPSRLTDGNYAIIGASGPIESGAVDAASEADTVVSANTLTMTFYLPAISVFAGSAIPQIGVEVAAFNGSSSGGLASPATDCVPRPPQREVTTAP